MRKALLVVTSVFIMLISGTPVLQADVITIAIPEEIEGTDIQQISWGNVVHDLLFDRLIVFNEDMTKLVPGFASAWKMSDDGLTLRFTIPDGLSFSSGLPVTPLSIKTSFDRYLELSPYKSDLAALKAISIEGSDAVMQWKNPPVPVFLVLSSTFGGIVDTKTAVSMEKDAFNRKTVGYGPMLVDEWVQGSHITLTRNPNFRTSNPNVKNKGPMKVEKVIVRFIPDDFTRVTEIQSGGSDIIWNVPTENISELKQNKNIQLYSALQPGSLFLYVNPDKPGLDDQNVRRALQRCINKDELVMFLNDAAQPRYGIMSSAMVGFSEAHEKKFKEKYGYDMAMAKKLLDDAGWKDTDKDGYRDKDGNNLVITMMVGMDYAAAKKLAPLLQDQFKRIGVKLNLREYEAKYIKQSVREKKFDLGTRNFRWADGDMLTYLFHKNSGCYDYPDINKLIDDARYELNGAKRAELYGQAQELILDKGLAIPLISSYRFVAVRSEIEGFKMNAAGSPVINDIARKK